jgi:hypothetical protein
MIWWNLILLLVSFIATYLLTPKPKTESQRPGRLNDINFPHATDGSPAPIMLGKCRQEGPNTLWYGDFKAVMQYKKVSTGILSSENVEIGFNYFLGLQLGLCLGNDVRLRRIFFEKKTAWTGNVGPGYTRFLIDKPNIFGGKEHGGGWIGYASFYGGEWVTQSVDPYLYEKAKGSDVPAYRGTSYIVFEHNYIGESAQLRVMSFELEHYPNSLSVGGSQNIIGDDLNPAEALFFMMTDTWSGAGVDPGLIDVASFANASSVLYTEGNGISLLVSASNAAKDVFAEVLRQIDGILYQDPASGKLVLKLIRDDYNLDDLPIFDESNIVAVKSFSRTSWSETMNETRVTFTDRGAKYAQGTAIVQNMANINAQGRLRSQTLSFPGCCTAELAVKLASRELAQLCVPLFRAQFEMNREAVALRPGDPFIWAWDDYNIVQVVMRVQKIDTGSLDDGRIIIDAVQDIFGASDVIFAAPESTLTDPLDRDPVAIETGMKLWQEIPYFIMSKQTIIASPLPVDSAWTLGLARSPAANQVGYTMYVDTDSGFGDPSTDVDAVPYTSTALLGTAILAIDGKSGSAISVDLKLLDPDDFVPTTKTTTESRNGDSLFQIGYEIFSYTTVVDHGNDTYTLTAHRALMDTVFDSHSVDDIVYFINNSNGIGNSTFGDTSTVYAKFQSVTDLGCYDVSGETPYSLTFSNRYDRPYPPDLPKFDGFVTPPTVTGIGPHTISWYERNRTTSSIVFEDDATETPESSQTYRVEFWKDGSENVSLRKTGVSGTSTTVTYASPYTSTPGGGEIRIYAERGGLLSWTCAQIAQITYDIPPPP